MSLRVEELTGSRKRKGERRPREGYYGRPAVKASPWNWMVASYIFVAGLAGGAQLLAGAAGLVDRRRFAGPIRNARLLALGGSVAGVGLLIADLRTPQRWYNMLRIVRPTSPMSLGTYILSGFGGFTALTALGPLFGRRNPTVRRVADAAQIPAAVTGAGAATYTAALLAATSTPAWAAAPRELAVSFGTSSVASAAAALSAGEALAGRESTRRRLDDVAAVATAAHLAAGWATAQRRRRRGALEGPSETRPARRVEAADLLLGGILPLGLYAADRATGRRSPWLSVAAAVCVLAGSAALRQSTLDLGKASTREPETYLGFTRPRAAHRLGRHPARGPRRPA